MHHVEIVCSDLIGVLCRALDQVRRMGIEVTSVVANSDGPHARVDLILGAQDMQLMQTLRERIVVMPGVETVGLAPAKMTSIA